MRNGSGSNPVCFSGSSAPILGTSWTAQIDAGDFPFATLGVVFGYDRGLAGLPTVYGELLVAPEPLGILLVASVQPVQGTTSPHSLPIPLDTELIGTFVATQAALLGGGTVLCNALDLTLGDG